MSDRLNELRRQRALVQQQADWLDREIAACAGTEQPTAAPTPVVSGATAGTSAPAPDASLTIEDQIYTPDPAGASARAKRGCFLYFALAFLLLAVGLLAFFYLRYGDRPLLFMEKDVDPPSHSQAMH